MKPLIAKLHKYVALSVGVLVAMMGLTGAMLAFRPALEEQFHPERRVTRPADAQPSLERVLQSARKAVPLADGYTIDVPDDPLRAYKVTVDPTHQRMFIDPYSGKLITNTHETELPFDWLFQLHFRLLAGDVGLYLVTAIGAMLLFLGTTGVILWWPRKWKNALRVRWGGGRLGLNYDLHNVVGAVFSLFFLLSAVTGIILLFSGPVGRLVGTLAGNPIAVAPKLGARDPAPATRASLDRVVKAATGALPEGRVKRVIVPTGHAPVVTRMQFPGNNHPNGLNRVYVDPYDASVVGTLRLAGASPGNRMYDWLYPLHTGRLFGTAHQVLQVIIGLAPAFMLVTGLIVWWLGRSATRRRLASRSASSRAAGAS